MDPPSSWSARRWLQWLPPVPWSLVGRSGVFACGSTNSSNLSSDALTGSSNDELHRMLSLLRALHAELELSSADVAADAYGDDARGDRASLTISLDSISAMAQGLQDLCQFQPSESVLVRVTRPPALPSKTCGDLEEFVAFYESLFRAHAKMMSSGQLELFLGVGELLWQTERSTFRHPVAIVPVRLVLLPCGTFEVVKSPSEAPLLCWNILRETSALAVVAFQDLEAGLSQRRSHESPPNLFACPATRRDLLKSVATLLHPGCIVVEGKAATMAVSRSTGPQIVDTCVLFCRRVGTAQAPRADLIRMMQALAVRPRERLPPGPAHFVRWPVAKATNANATETKEPSCATGSMFPNGRGKFAEADKCSVAHKADFCLPLPCSVEQLAVVDAVIHGEAVVVVGPPGTGKTHCIANVCCEAVRLGWRVLVLSDRDQALDVLHAKLPLGLRSWTVHLRSGGSWDSQRELQRLLERICGLPSLDLFGGERTLEVQMDELRRCRERLRNVDTEIEALMEPSSTHWDIIKSLWLEIREADRDNHEQKTVTTCSGTGDLVGDTADLVSMAQLAKFTSKGLARGPQLFEEVLAWPVSQQRLDDAVISEMRELRRVLSPAWPFPVLPDAKGVPPYEQLSETHQELASARPQGVVTRFEPTRAWQLDGGGSSWAKVRGAIAGLLEAVKSYACLESKQWERTANAAVAGDSAQGVGVAGASSAPPINGALFLGHLRRFDDDSLEALHSKSIALTAALSRCKESDVHVPGGSDSMIMYSARALATGQSHLRVLGFFQWARSAVLPGSSPRRRLLEEQLASVRVRGAPLLLDIVDGWSAVESFVALRRAAQEFVVAWGCQNGPCAAPAIHFSFDMGTAGNSVDVGHGHGAAFKALARWWEEGPSQVLHETIGIRRRVLESLRFVLELPAVNGGQAIYAGPPAHVGGAPRSAEEAWQAAAALFAGASATACGLPAGTAAALAPETVPTCVRSLVAMARGSEPLEAEAWRRCLEELGDLNRSADAQGHSRHGMRRLRELTRCLPVPWAARVLQARSAESGDPLPENWRHLWACKRAEAFIFASDCSGRLNDRLKVRREVDAELREAADTALGQAVLLGIQRRLAPRHLASLRHLADSLRTLAQSSAGSQRAARARFDLREALPVCFQTFPLSLMTLSNAATMLPAEPGMFDLVILDEGSQSEPQAISTLLRGRRNLIVGDERQVSPLEALRGVRNSERHVEIAQQLVARQPCGRQVLPGRSIFDAARATFVGAPTASQHTLREHFRCVPELIAWCNARYYHGMLQPLRIPRAHERLDPPLIDCFVPGVKVGRRNVIEAERVLEEVGRILSDPILRSVGVIAMTSDQTELIERRMRKAFEASVWARHKLRVGSPRSFQGDERDVVIISLVEDPASARYAHVKIEDHQRYNVAMSRARDCLVLVRSCTPDHIRANRSADARDELKLSVIQHFQRTAGKPGAGLRSVDRRVVLGVGATVLLEKLRRTGFEAHRGVWLRDGVRIDIIVEDRRSARRVALVVDGDAVRAAAVQANRDDGYVSTEVCRETFVAVQLAMERVGWGFLHISAAMCLLAPAAALDAVCRFVVVDCGIKPRQVRMDSKESSTCKGSRVGIAAAERGWHGGHQSQGDRSDENHGSESHFKECSSTTGASEATSAPSSPHGPENILAKEDTVTKTSNARAPADCKGRQSPASPPRRCGEKRRRPHDVDCMEGEDASFENGLPADDDPGKHRRTNGPPTAGYHEQTRSAADRAERKKRPSVASHDSPPRAQSSSRGHGANSKGRRWSARGRQSVSTSEDDDDDDDDEDYEEEDEGEWQRPLKKSRTRRSSGGANVSSMAADSEQVSTSSPHDSFGGDSAHMGSDGGSCGRSASEVRRLLAELGSTPGDIVTSAQVIEGQEGACRRGAEAEREVDRILAARSARSVLKGATAAARRREFRRLALLVHPDKGNCAGDRAALALRRLLAAYQTAGTER
eukprot:TRINITY_DN45216_c0_g1_i1.p1 TRINITY_DN45216_c0_g1~~TRINITY_DN45216_c0_g1_i1.p1  ORF type:complete len:1977 (+),score=287.73 TRINITY_DN45216_c0_g1_i1:196-6126(+)